MMPLTVVTPAATTLWLDNCKMVAVGADFVAVGADNGQELIRIFLT
jgi:hypothetical protein